MNYRRWLIVAYILLLMAFTTSVLLIPGQKYETLTTSDSGWVYEIAVEMDRTNALVENNPLSHAPDGLEVSLGEQAQPLFAVMMYRGVSTVNPSVTLMDVVKYYAPVIFALSLIPIFLMGRELAGDTGGIAAAFFAATLASTIYWNKVGAFDREPTQLLLGAWAMYLTVKLFKAPRPAIPKFALLTGLMYGLFGLAWSGWHHLIAVMTLGLLFVLVAGFLGKLLHKISDVFGALFHTIRSHLDLIVGVLGMMLVITIVLCVLGGQSPLLWTGVFQSYASYIGLGGGAGGVGWTAPASEARPPGEWGETLGRFYNYQGGAEILTTFILILIAIALAKFLWSRKRWEWLVLAWLIVLVVMVWPEKGQVRFERLWWPMVPVLAGVGMATLVRLVRRFSFESSGEWLKHLLNPLALVLVACIIAVPFAYNAYVVAEKTTPPTGGLDPGYIEAFTWLRENTPEDSVAAIQWSYGHLLTGASQRPTVTDGADPDGQEGVWESDPTFTPRPPDYIYYVEGGQTYGYGVDVSRKPYDINGRRVDVEWFPIASENEFRWYMTAYRDNYNCKIDYVIFSAREYYSALDYYLLYNDRVYYERGYGFQAENILLGAKVIKTLSQAPTVEDQTYTFNFGENREAVVLDQGTNSAYLRADGETLYLDGYGVLLALSGGREIYYGISIQHVVSFYQPSSTPDIQETLLIYIDEQGRLSKASLVEGASAEVSERPLPMAIRAYWGAIADIDYLQIPFTSSDGVVKVLKINHVPTLTSPENNAMINDNTPEFTWKGAVGAARYALQIDDAQDFTAPVYGSDNSGTTYTLPDNNALEPGTWYWRVGAYDSENKLLGWSENFAFTLDIQAPEQPQLSEPLDNVSTLEVSFSWTEPESGVKYDIQIDNEQDFDNIYYVYETTGLTDNSHSYTFLRNGEYYWRVRAVDAAGNSSEWSDNFTLTVRAPPQAPTLSSPENEALTNENMLTLQWTGGNGDNYRLMLDNDADFSSPNVDEILAPSDTSYSIVEENALLDGTYAWKVVAIVGAEENFEVWTFTVDTTPPEAPTLVAPENDNTTIDNIPTFEWIASSDADNHRLVVDNSIDFEEPLLIDNTLGATDNTYTPLTELAADNYWWKVIALDAAGNDNSSPVWFFTVASPEE